MNLLKKEFTIKMETKQLFKEFKKFKESENYNDKYEGSISFLLENKPKELIVFDEDLVWENTNTPVKIKLIKKFDLKENEDLVDFYVYINRDLLRREKLKEDIEKLKKEGKKEIFWDSYEFSDNKKILKVYILDQYERKEIEGRLVKVESEKGLFLIAKGKSRKGLRLNKKENYFI